jgi:type VI secretion system protein VasD
MDISRALLQRSVPILLLCLCGGILQGCGTKPTRLDADVIAADDVNKDTEGRSLPIVVRIYELKTTGTFQGADFYSLYDKESETLGADLLAREELNLRPGEQRKIERVTAPDAQYMGVVGAFRDIDKARWKATHPLTAGEVNKVEVELGPDSVSIH